MKWINSLNVRFIVFIPFFLSTFYRPFHLIMVYHIITRRLCQKWLGGIVVGDFRRGLVLDSRDDKRFEKIF